MLSGLQISPDLLPLILTRTSVHPIDRPLRHSKIGTQDFLFVWLSYRH